MYRSTSTVEWCIPELKELYFEDGMTEPVFVFFLRLAHHPWDEGVSKPPMGIHSYHVATSLLEWKQVQGSQVSRIERECHKFRSFVTHSRHTMYFSRGKTIYNICYMPQRPTKLSLAAPLLLWDRQESSTSSLEFLVELATYQPIKKKKVAAQ